MAESSGVRSVTRVELAWPSAKGLWGAEGGRLAGRGSSAARTELGSCATTYGNAVRFTFETRSPSWVAPRTLLPQLSLPYASCAADSAQRGGEGNCSAPFL